MDVGNFILKFIGFGVREAMGDTVMEATEFIQSRIASQTDALHAALRSAYRRAWRIIGMALAGDGFVQSASQWLQPADNRALAGVIDELLNSGTLDLSMATPDFRQACLKEWRDARDQSVFTLPDYAHEELIQAVRDCSLSRHDVFAAADALIRDAAGDLSKTYPHLGQLIQMKQLGQPPLLAAAFAYFLRLEIRKKEELADELNMTSLRELAQQHRSTWKRLDQVCRKLDRDFDRLFDHIDHIDAITSDTHLKVQELEKLIKTMLDERSIPRQGSLRGQDSHCIHTETERRLVHDLLQQYRQLDSATRQLFPELLNNLGRLQVCAGDYDEAQTSFRQVADYRMEDPAKAEEWYNAHLAALEAKAWEPALEHLLKADHLDPKRFHLFPMEKYEPLRILGAGGFGVAFLCMDKHTQLNVVVKTLHHDCLDRETNDLFHEAGVLWNLRHPNIISALSTDYVRGAEQRTYMVLDYFDGENLADFRAQQRLDESDVKVIARQIAEGVRAAHRAGIIHRDLKPGNVLVKKDGATWQVKVIDFGLALKPAVRPASYDQRHSVFGHTIAGSISYAPPEQKGLRPDIQIGPHSDIYAFGKMLGYLLYGTLNWKTRHYKNVSPHLNELVDRCTDDEPGYRPKSFDEILKLLDLPTAEKDEKKPASHEQQAAKTSTAKPSDDAAESKFAAFIQNAMVRKTTLRLTFEEWPTLLNAMRDALQVAVPNLAPLSLDTRLKEAFSFACPQCGTLDNQAVFNLAAKRHVFGRRHCPGCRGHTLDLLYDPSQTASAMSSIGPKQVAHYGQDEDTTRPANRSSMRGKWQRGINAFLIVLFISLLSLEFLKPEPKKKTVPKLKKRQAKQVNKPDAKPTTPEKTVEKHEILYHRLDLPKKACMLFVDLSPGHFWVANAGKKSRIWIGNRFRLGAREVTELQWKALMDGPSGQRRSDYNPVEHASWHDAMEFCRKLTEREKKAKRLPSGCVYRLPTEAEWEYAARGGLMSRGFAYSGSDRLADVGKYKSRSSSTVALRQRNELGLYDMSGNVWEWCLDTYRPDYYATLIGTTNPCHLAASSHRVLRGGGWNSQAEACRLDSRSSAVADHKAEAIGFRVCLGPEIVRQADPPATPPQEPVTQEDRKAPEKEKQVEIAPAKLLPLAQDVHMAFMHVKTGTFSMGWLTPSRNVSIGHEYWLGRHEVTQAQWLTLMSNNPSAFRGSMRPVENVNWIQAGKFCEKLTVREKQVGRLPPQYEYRLPTETEWEYAAKGGTQRHTYRYSGSDDPDAVAWHQANSRETHPVAAKKPNALGLFDMSGNVKEWCYDTFHEKAYYAFYTSSCDPLYLDHGPDHVLRGGSWRDVLHRARTTTRDKNKLTSTSNAQGFRVCLGVIKPEKPVLIEIQQGCFMTFIPVKGSHFRIGSDHGQPDEKPAHKVYVSDFYLGVLEVTQAQWDVLMPSNPSKYRNAKHPVENVSWHDAVAFCAKWTAIKREKGQLPEGCAFRLPTEAEWEYAARGGFKSCGYFYSGSDDSEAVAWHKQNATSPVGGKKANELGLHDMSGNVLEWCYDVYDPDFYKKKERRINPVNKTADGDETRVFRGGSWQSVAAACRVSFRNASGKAFHNETLGFRVCLGSTLDPEPALAKKPEVIVNPIQTGYVILAPDIRMDFVHVLAGPFRMGSNHGISNENPEHDVVIHHDFWLGTCEVTQEQWKALMAGSEPSHFSGAKHPVENINWNMANNFCRKLTAREIGAGRLPPEYAYRLPTEAEWEYAARGGPKSIKFPYSGGRDAKNVAWYHDNSNGMPHPVGQRKANELGLYDMSGNVEEWCLDYYDTDYYKKRVKVDPLNADPTMYRVKRGGHWFSTANGLRTSARSGLRSIAYTYNIGFRVCLARQR